MEMIGKRKIWSADEIAAMSGVPSAQLSDWADAGILCDKGRVVYVGQSVSVYARVSRHLAEGEKEFDSAFWIAVPIELLNQTESGFIRLLNPKYNKDIPADMGPIPDNIITFTTVSPSEAMDEVEKADEVMVK